MCKKQINRYSTKHILLKNVHFVHSHLNKQVLSAGFSNHENQWHAPPT